MEKQITIIIPTYNMEKYIGKCLDSLLTPEFDQVEVLVVNDGSKDRSSEIAHEYADRYPDSIRVIDKPNGNYGSCINAALPLATGRYVKILDADDTFDTAEFSRLVQLLPSVDDDVILTPFVNVDEDGNITCRDPENYYGVELYKSYMFEDICNKALALYPTMHRLCYKLDIFNRFSYHQTEGISYTDTQWAMIPQSYAQSCYFTDIYLYKYLIGRTGQTMSPEQMIKSFSHLLKVSEDMIMNYKECDLTGMRKTFFLSRILSFNKSIFLTAIRSGTESIMNQLKVYDNSLSTHHSDIYALISDIRYDNASKFRFISDIRKNNYPTHYKIPTIELLKLSINLKIEKFKNRLCCR